MEKRGGEGGRGKLHGVGFEHHFWVFAQGGEFNKSTPISSVNDSSGIDPEASALHFTSLRSPLRRHPPPPPPSFPHLADCELSTEMVRARDTEPRSQRGLTLSPAVRHQIPHSQHRFPAPTPHSEHRFPAPSSTFRASLSGTFLHIPSIAFRHIPHTPSIAFRHLPLHSEHRFPAPSSTF